MKEEEKATRGREKKDIRRNKKLEEIGIQLVRRKVT